MEEGDWKVERRTIKDLTCAKRYGWMDEYDVLHFF